MAHPIPPFAPIPPGQVQPPIAAFAPIPPRQLQVLGSLLQQQEHDDAAMLGALLHERRRRRRRTCFWVRPWITRRPQFGDYENLMVELEREAQGDFKNYLRMETHTQNHQTRHHIPSSVGSGPEASHHPQIHGYWYELSQPELLIQGSS